MTPINIQFLKDFFLPNYVIHRWVVFLFMLAISIGSGIYLAQLDQNQTSQFIDNLYVFL